MSIYKVFKLASYPIYFNVSRFLMFELLFFFIIKLYIKKFYINIFYLRVIFNSTILVRELKLFNRFSSSTEIEIL